MEMIITTGKKEFYNTDGQKAASEWVREEVKNNGELPLLTSGITVKTNPKKAPNCIIEQLAYFYNDSNNVYKNSDSVSLLSSTFSNGHGLSVIPENFHKVTTLFTARKTHIGEYWNWINQKDEYLAPNEDHPKWEQFVADSLVYSLFHIHSFQSSLRQVDYKGKKWDIKNEFFWLKRD